MIAEIETRRKSVGVTQRDLCKRAGVNATTYSLLKNKRRGAYSRTLEKLDEALDKIEQEQGTANG